MKTIIRILAFAICLFLLSACSSSNSSDGWTAVSDALSSASSHTASSGASSSIGDVSSLTQSEIESLVSSGVISSEQASSIIASQASSKPAQNANDGKNRYSGTRDPFSWPFAEDSIWNMPIGSNAKLQKANFRDEDSVGVDVEYIVKVPEGSPTVEIKSPSAWNARWPGNLHQGYMQVPSDFYLADANPPNTPNNCAAFVMPDGRTIKQLEPTCRLGTGNTHIVGWLWSPKSNSSINSLDIYGDGIGGSHYGSGLSAIGGSIRKGELTSSEPIKHAIKLNVYAKNYLYYDRSADCGYVWPADRHDSYAASGNNAYGGTNPNLRMGSLLTIPKNITVESLGIKSEVGKKIFYALQNYGCYIVDDSAWSNYSFSMENGVMEEVQAKYGYSVNCAKWSVNDYYYDVLKMVKNLYIVTNNSPSSIGGGGTPCKPLAPLFE